MRQALSEWIGTALLLAIVTGSGIMGESLANGNAAVALLGNSIATGAGLYVLITLLGPLSGAHFNPVVSLLFWSEKKLSTRVLVAYGFAQFTGALAGVWTTHLMFGLPISETSLKSRHSPGLLVSEVVATLVLLLVIRLGVRQSPDKVPLLVALTVTAGYWFTSSTFFCNPAVTFARSFTNTFVGIAPNDVGPFILMELVALGLILVLDRCFKDRSLEG